MAEIGEGLAALALHLRQRRAVLLQTWRRAVDDDSELTTATTLSRNQFFDHIPAVLDAFEARLRGPEGDEAREDAAAHGLHRWQLGFHLREVTREWSHLHLCLLDELEDYAAAHPELAGTVMPPARRLLARLVGDGVSESTARYFSLQQAEAAGSVRDLEQALAQWKALERQQGKVWREAAHDLRGSLGVVKTITAALEQTDPDPTRAGMLAGLKRGVDALQNLLEDVLSLARLQAGQERRHVQLFDAGAALVDLCAQARTLADARGLALVAEGPTPFPVEGDPVKVRRIAENLLLNALKYTAHGGVTVTWGDSRPNDAQRWMLCVQDTGAGVESGSAAPVAGALAAATEEARAVDDGADVPPRAPGAPEEPAGPGPAQRAPVEPPGEGIGLSIVKRLCELLDASVELETEAGRGTTVWVFLPRSYTDATPPAQ